MARKQKQQSTVNTPSGEAASRQSLWPIAIGIALLALLAHARGVGNDFIINYDDGQYVTENNAVLGGLSASGIAYACTAQVASNWHPLTILSLMLDTTIFGTSAFGYHLTNLLLHVVNAALCLIAFYALTGARWRSAALAAIFAVHPIHVESVASIAQRKDLLCGLFWLLAMLAYARYVSKPDWRRHAWVSFALCLGLLSKPVMVTFPFALLLLDVWPLARVTRESATRLVREKLPWFGLSAVFSVVTWWVQRTAGAVQAHPLSNRLENVAIAYLRYISKAIWPSPLAAHYPGVEHIPAWKWAAAVCALLVMTALAVACIRNRAYVTAGWFWFLGTLVPMIGLIQVGGQSMADRYAYITFFGLYIIAVWGFADVISRFHVSSTAIGVTLTTVLIVFTSLTYRQTGYWRDAFSLWGHMAAVTDDKTTGNLYLGAAYYGAGDMAKAESLFRDAVAHTPDSQMARKYLAETLLELNRFDDAAREYDLLAGKTGRTYARIGDSFLKHGQRELARRYYREGLSKYPDFALLHMSMGVYAETEGDKSAALREYQEAKRLDPKIPNIDAVIARVQRDQTTP